MAPWRTASYPHDHFAPGSADRNFGRIGGKMAGVRRNAEMLNRTLRRIGVKTDRKDRGDHGITAAGPRVPPSAVQTAAEAT